MADAPVVTVTPAPIGPESVKPQEASAPVTPSNPAPTNVTPPAPPETPTPALATSEVKKETPPTVAPKTALEDATVTEVKGDTKEAPSPEAVDVYKSVKPPEGMKLDTPTWQAVAPVLAKNNIKPEVAQELVNEFAKAESARVASEQRAYAKINADMKAECAKFFKSEDYVNANKGVNMFQDPVLKQFVISQLGNHPDFIRVMAKIGQAIREDGTPGTLEGKSVETKTAEQRFANAAGWNKKQ